ncbi:porin [Vibrio parahaemolyticus]|nr:porin [Vibrio parahaemolyticus]
MKKYALLLPSLLASSIAIASDNTGQQDLISKVDVMGNGTQLALGGFAEGRLGIKDGEATDKSRFRLKVLAEHQINDNLYGFGYYEGDFYTSSDDRGVSSDGNESQTNHRWIHAGIGGDFGEFAIGKTGGSLYYLTDFTDILRYHGNRAADKIQVGDRADNMVSYVGTHLEGNLRVHGSYRFADSQYDAQNDTFTNNGRDGYSASASYRIPSVNLEIGVGYAEQGESDEVMIGANYGIGGFYAAVLFTDGQKDDYSGDNDTSVNTASYQGQEAALSYLFADKYKLSATYNASETGGYTTVDEVAIEARYYFAPKLRAYLSYNFNAISAGDTISDQNNLGFSTTASNQDAENEVAIGIRYDF